MIGNLLAPIDKSQQLGLMIVLDEVKVENIEKENLNSLIDNGFYDDDLTQLEDIKDLGNHLVVYSIGTQNKMVLPEMWLAKNYLLLSTGEIPAQS